MRKKKNKKRILIVDDDEIVVLLVEEILQKERFQTEIARDGMEGLEKIKQNEYDVIISNQQMPRMNERRSALPRSAKIKPRFGKKNNIYLR
ncbi:MAG: response regulator [Ignavibacteriales bacterium]